MTYTKRQKFIYRFRQHLNMLEKSIKYLVEVNDYMKESKFFKVSNKILKRLIVQKEKSEKLLEVVDKRRLSNNGIFRKD